MLNHINIHKEVSLQANEYFENLLNYISYYQNLRIIKRMSYVAFLT